MQAMPLQADAEERCYTVTDPVYGTLACRWDGPLTVNGQPMVYSGYDRFGKLTVTPKAED